MRQRDGRRRLFKTFTACLLALAMLLSNVGVMDVRAQSTVKKPKIDQVSIGATKVTGGGLVGFNQRKAVGKVCKIHITVKDSEGTEIETKVFSIEPNERGTTWSVTLDNKLQKGWKVYAKQEFNGAFSPEISEEAQEFLADLYKDKLTMPALEVWSEDLNVIEEDAQKDIIDKFRETNKDLDKVKGKTFEENVKSISASGNGKTIDVTFIDDSKLEVDASKVTVNKITEYSGAPIVDTLHVVDGKITGKISGKGPFNRARVEIVTNFGETNPKNFCTENGCTIDKGTKEFATVNPQDGTFSYDLKGIGLTIGKDIGVIVKEYRKLASCTPVSPQIKIPKVDVRDPRKLTDENKAAIDKAIREANTTKGGVSKMPDGTGDWDGIPAYIEFDKDGNARIINPSNVEGDWDWDNDGIFVPEKNDDGSLKVKDEEQVIKIPAKDLVKNIKPEAPAVKLSEDEEKVTVTSDLKDTDAKTIKVSYTDPDGSEKTVEATKDDDNWTAPKGFDISVDSKTGAVTLSFPASMAKDGSKVKATVTDNGGLTDEEKPLTSGEGECTLPEKPEVSFDANGGSGTMDSVKVKKGSTYKLPANKFTPPTGKEFKGWEVDGKEYAPNDEITVDGDVTVKAIWKDTPAEPKPEGPTDDRPLYKGSILILPGGEAKAEEPAMEIGRHIRYLYGYEDRTVRPEGKITRAEAAALIARLAELDMSDKSKPDFADTPSSWYNSAINIMVKKNLMFGDKNGNFRPNEAITRGEFARALLYIDAKNDKVAPFADVKGHEFEEAINQAYGNGRINGYPDGTFRPDAYIQRAEAARILNQYANRGTTLEGMAPVAKDLARFTDIDESHWAYCEIMEAANSHEYQRAKGTQAEAWLKILYDEMKK